MSEELSQQDILRITQILQQQQSNQNPEMTPEQFLMNTLLNPVRMKTTRNNIMDTENNSIVTSESREGSIINQDGYIEEIIENNVFMLDDGTSTSGIVQCQSCYSVIKEENTRRCSCGKTCCLIPGCGIYLKSTQTWYCCLLHAILGFFHISIR